MIRYTIQSTFIRYDAGLRHPSVMALMVGTLYYDILLIVYGSLALARTRHKNKLSAIQINLIPYL